MSIEDIQNDARKEDGEMLIRRFVSNVGYDYIQHHKKTQQKYTLIFQMKREFSGKK